MNFSLKKHRQKFFNELASTWNNSHRFAHDQQCLIKLIPDLPLFPGNSVLDIGTGTGIALKPLQQAVGPTGKVVGIDFSLEMVKQALIQHSIVLQCDSHYLPFRDRIFNFVFAFAVIPHLDNIPRFFQEINSVLLPEGYLVVLHFMSRKICNDFHRKVGTSVKNDRLPSSAELHRLASKNNMEPIRFVESEDLFLWIAQKLD